MPRPRTGSVSWHVDHWDVRLSLPGGRRSPPIHLPSTIGEAEARRQAADWAGLALEGKLVLEGTTEPPRAAGETVAELGKSWLRLVKASALAPATIAGHGSNFRIRIEPKLGAHTIKTLSTGVVRQWLREIRVGLSATKVRDTYNTLAKMLDECAAEGWIDFETSPCRHPKVRAELPAVELPDEDDVQTLSERQVATMLHAFAPFVVWLRELVGATSGMRDEEIAGLTFASLEERHGVPVYRIRDVIAVRGEEGWASSKATKNASSKRRVPVHPAVLPYLDAWKSAGWRAHVGREPNT